jgi:DNA helicase-2/ATP-dependent DNA helicase PcrA
MTLHSAKGLEFDNVFLPGWEEGLFPHQRALDEQGRAGLEEERRLAHVGITRARRRAKLYFATNRRIHGSWTTTIPSRFLDELPEAHVEVADAGNSYGGYGSGRYGGGGFASGRGGGPYGASRFDKAEPFSNTYATPGWQRAQERWSKGEGLRSTPKFIEGEMVTHGEENPALTKGTRIFHQKFGYGRITSVDGNKLTIDFEKAGEKRVLDSFVTAA